MKSIQVIVIIIFALMTCSCTKSDTGGTKQESKITTPALPADSTLVDSTISDLQKKTDEIKNDAEDLQKAVDDLLK
jgi:peptidoglycan hydrolase CwlO-like protein